MSLYSHPKPSPQYGFWVEDADGPSEESDVLLVMHMSRNKWTTPGMLVMGRSKPEQGQREAGDHPSLLPSAPTMTSKTNLFKEKGTDVHAQP